MKSHGSSVELTFPVRNNRGWNFSPQTEIGSIFLLCQPYVRNIPSAV